MDVNLVEEEVVDKYVLYYDPGRGGFGKRYNPMEMEKGGVV